MVASFHDAARSRYRRTLLAMLAIAAIACVSCSFKSDGLADDNPFCGAGDCGTTDGAPDTFVGDGPPEDTFVPPGTNVSGDFVGAAVSGAAGGITLQGSLHWFSAVHGSNAGITLEGTLE